LRALLSAQEGFNVLTVLEANVENIESVTVESPPDVALVHFAILTADGFGAIAAIRRRWPGVRVLALTSRLDEPLLGATTEAGIEGCLLESDGHTELLSAVHSVSRGERYRTSSIALQSVGRPDKLTDREREVMRLIAAGYRTREIAQRLSLSRKTIEKHRASLMRKLGLRSAAAVAAYAIANGYLVV